MKSPKIFSTVEKFVGSEVDGSETLVYPQKLFVVIKIKIGISYDRFALDFVKT